MALKMCTYIGLVLPASANVELFRELVEEPLDPKPIQNSFIKQQIESNESIYLATSNYCDCDTPLGKGQGIVSAHDLEIDKQELIAWQISISRTIGAGIAPYIGIFLHFYSGDIQTEDVRFVSIESVSLEKLSSTFLENIGYDTLYRIGSF